MRLPVSRFLMLPAVIERARRQEYRDTLASEAFGVWLASGSKKPFGELLTALGLVDVDEGHDGGKQHRKNRDIGGRRTSPKDVPGA